MSLLSNLNYRFPDLQPFALNLNGVVILDLRRTSSGEWILPQIAAQFTGKNTKKKLDTITENLERLEWFGLVICQEHNGILHWHYTETIAAA